MSDLQNGATFHSKTVRVKHGNEGMPNASLGLSVRLACGHGLRTKPSKELMLRMGDAQTRRDLDGAILVFSRGHGLHVAETTLVNACFLF